MKTSETRGGLGKTNEAPRFLHSRPTPPESSGRKSDGVDIALSSSKSEALRVPPSVPKPLKRPKVRMVEVSNKCGGLIYLRGPKIGEVRLAHGESFAAAESLMPMSLIAKLVRENKLGTNDYLVDGE